MATTKRVWTVETLSSNLVTQNLLERIPVGICAGSIYSVNNAGASGQSVLLSKQQERLYNHLATGKMMKHIILVWRDT